MKRLKIKLVEEFKKLDTFEGRGMKFKFDDIHSIHLIWGMNGGRWISLRHDLSRTYKDYNYKNGFIDVPISILRASIKYLRERNEKKKKKNT